MIIEGANGECVNAFGEVDLLLAKGLTAKYIQFPFL
jgi:hypothetical protein